MVACRTGLLNYCCHSEEEGARRVKNGGKSLLCLLTNLLEAALLRAAGLFLCFPSPGPRPPGARSPPLPRTRLGSPGCRVPGGLLVLPSGTCAEEQSFPFRNTSPNTTQLHPKSLYRNRKLLRFYMTGDHVVVPKRCSRSRELRA